MTKSGSLDATTRDDLGLLSPGFPAPGLYSFVGPHWSAAANAGMANTPRSAYKRRRMNPPLERGRFNKHYRAAAK
jgi:hypothetical protein